MSNTDQKLGQLTAEISASIEELRQSNRHLEHRATRAEQDLIAYHSALTEAVRRIRALVIRAKLAHDEDQEVHYVDLMKVMDDPANAPRDWERRSAAVQVPAESGDQPVQQLRGDD